SMNETVFEALFRQAVINNFKEEIESIPSKDQLAKNYSFSPIFEMKMKKVFAKDQRKSFIKMSMNYARKVASIIIIVFGIMFFTLLFSPEVRAAVGNVFVEWYEKFTSFTYRTEEAIV
ncbi:hypothetical protein, partial [Stenotrophomonas maltophilia group sp. RNC7]|uniref:hypothetical protein n=1 Tax=Stenotrophomonas maltophilia group sp. RNC7 TaxID=3071467 RepID=UPI0027E02C19